MTKIWVSLVALLLLISGTLGVSMHYLTGKLAVAEQQVETLVTAHDSYVASVNELNLRVELLSREDASNKRELAALQTKALKDTPRVENIVDKKPTLYERFVNRDYKNSQKELGELME